MTCVAKSKKYFHYCQKNTCEMERQLILGWKFLNGFKKLLRNFAAKNFVLCKRAQSKRLKKESGFFSTLEFLILMPASDSYARNLSSDKHQCKFLKDEKFIDYTKQINRGKNPGLRQIFLLVLLVMRCSLFYKKTFFDIIFFPLYDFWKTKITELPDYWNVFQHSMCLKETFDCSCCFKENVYCPCWAEFPANQGGNSILFSFLRLLSSMLVSRHKKGELTAGKLGSVDNIFQNFFSRVDFQAMKPSSLK